MSYSRSPKDILSEVSAQIKRALSDVTIDYLGTETQVLRIELGEQDVMGDRDETLVTNLIANVIIKHPMGNNQWLFSTLNTDDTLQTDSINLWDILPISMKIKFAADFETEPVAIQKGDMIVELLQDENFNHIPVIYQVTKLLGGFEGKYLYQKQYELTLYRGTIPSDIQHQIDLFIAGERISTIATRNGVIVTPTIEYNAQQNIIDEFKAGEYLYKHRVVYIGSDGTAYLANFTDLTCMSHIIGLSASTTLKRGTVGIQTFGTLHDLDWSWIRSKPIFLGSNGEMTQTAVSSGFSLKIGYPLTSTSMFIDIEQPIVITN